MAGSEGDRNAVSPQVLETSRPTIGEAVRSVRIQAIPEPLPSVAPGDRKGDVLSDIAAYGFGDPLFDPVFVTDQLVVALVPYDADLPGRDVADVDIQAAGSVHPIKAELFALRVPLGKPACSGFRPKALLPEQPAIDRSVMYGVDEPLSVVHRHAAKRFPGFFERNSTRSPVTFGDAIRLPLLQGRICLLMPCCSSCEKHAILF